MKRIINAILLISCLCSLSLSAKTVKLTVMSKGNDVPLPATVILESKNGEAKNYRCDRNGRLEIAYPDSLNKVTLEIRHENYISAFFPITGERKSVNLGVIELESMPKELKEILVNAEKVSFRAGKTTILISDLERKRNYNATQLLADVRSSVPELKVDMSLHRISINDMSPVFQINGREQPMDRLIDLSPERIQKIEMTSYPDIRYDAPVFNIILKPNEQGGSVSLYNDATLTTPRNNSKATATYNYKKSEFLFDYNFNFRNSDEQYTNTNEKYIAPDFTIAREFKGLPSMCRDQSHQFKLDYVFMPGKNTVLALTGTATIKHYRYSSNGVVTQTFGSDKSTFESYNRRHNEGTPFKFLAYFKTSWKKQSLEINSALSKNKTVFDRELEYSDGYFSSSRNHFSGLSSGTKVNYSAKLPYSLSFEAGGNYTYTNSDSRLVQNDTPTNSDTDNHNLYLYSKLGWENRGFYVSGGPGLTYNKYIDGNGNSETECSYRIAASAGQRINRSMNINYSFNMGPSIPGMQNYSTVRQDLNDYSVQVGNPDLKASMAHGHSIRLNYRYKRLSLSPYVGISFTDKPILTHWEYSKADNLFVKTVINGKNSRMLSSGLNLSLSNIMNKFNFSVDLKYNEFKIDNSIRTVNKGRVSLDIDGSAYFGNLNIGFRFMPIREMQYMGYAYSINSSFNNIYAFYTYRQFQFGLRWRQMFTKKANRQQNYSLSQVHPSESEFYIKDFNSLVSFSVQYRINFGRSYRKPNIRMINVGAETNVATEY